MNHGLESLKRTKTIVLTTYEGDGTPIATPVSIAFDGERAFFRSYDRAWKTKRLCNNPNVDVAPATLRGKPTGPGARAQATPLSDDEVPIAAEALARRHPLLQRVLVPLAHRIMRDRTMHYELRAATRREWREDAAASESNFRRAGARSRHRRQDPLGAE